jgi:capsular exopolysaccharide synthesis family protein
MTQPSPYFIRRTGPLEEPSRGTGYGLGAFEEEEGRIDLLAYWHIVRKRLALVIGVVFAALVLTTIYAYMQTPKYTADATILLKPGTPQIMGGKDSSQDSDAMYDADLYENFQKTQYEILRSRTLAAYVIRAENLEHNQAFIGPKPQPGLIASALSSVSLWLNHTNGRKARPPVADQTLRNGVPPGLIGAYLGGLRISPIADTDLVTIEYVSTDRNLAAKLANAHAHGYIRFGIELRSQSNEEAQSFLKERLGELKDSLEKSEVALNDYRRAKGIIPGLMSLDGKETVVLDRVSELSKDLTTAQVERIGLEAQMQLINSRKYDSMPAVMGDTGVEAVQGQLNSLDADYASMGKKFKPDYPPMMQMEAKRAELERRLEAEISRVIAGIQGSYQAASDKEQKLQNEMNKERQQALGLNDAAVEYAILQREVDTNRELYESVLQRMKGVGLAAESQTSNIIIVDPAETPGAPSSPKKFSMIVRNSALALVAVIGLVFGLEYLDTTLKTPEQVERYLHVPNIGAIPSFANLRLKAKGAATLLPEDNGIKKIGYGRELLGVANPYSMVGEAYRTFRTALMLSRAGSPPKTILFTSAHSSEGKTVSATNTAAMFAQTGARVLLIDGDLRKPRCHRVLALENSSGLTEVLTGTCEVQDVIRTTVVDGLSFMSAGSLPPNPTELLGSERMSQVLAMVAHEHDVVIIDSPPVMPVSDALLLATVVDGVVLVVNSVKTSKHHVKMTCAKLEYARAKIFGVLLNEIDLKHPGYGHYSHYYNHYTRPDPDIDMPFKDAGGPDSA